ncbi:MAG: hypothetical protein ACRC33_12330 [Gemmataceae bacterium]
MNVEDLRQALRRNPFVPFRLRMRGGEAYDLPEVGRMVLPLGGTQAVVMVGDGMKFIDPREAVAIEPMKADRPAWRPGDPTITVEELRQALRRRPFVPFRLWMRNGEAYDVPEVGEMALAPWDTEAVVNVGESTRTFDPREAVAIEPMGD